MVASGSLLGRISLGDGGPEPVGVGTGLQLYGGTLAATGGDHAGFPVETALVPTDQAVLSSGGTPKLLPVALLRGLFSAGSNVSISPTGTISATAQEVTADGSAVYSIGGLSAVSAISSNDLVGINQAGIDHAISYANFINGRTIDEAQPATIASDTDTFWVAQGSSTMLRQTLSAIWAWLGSKMPSYKPPVVEITTNTLLDTTIHNGRILVCSQPATLTPAPLNMGSGFTCDVLNLSTANVTFATGIVTSSGSTVLAAGQAARLVTATYSGGTVVYAWTSNTSSMSTIPAVPGQVAGLGAGSITANSVTLSWAAASPAAASYVVMYRVSGTTTWSTASSVTGLECVVTGLTSGTSYDFTVSAASSGGTGLPSAILTTSTSSVVGVPGPVVALSASSPTSSTISLGWSAPTSGGTPTSYTVQYRTTGTTAWLTSVSGLTATSHTVTGLAIATSYDFQVVAVNASGTGAASAIATAFTTSGTPSVTAVNWNVFPSGSYVHGSNAIGVNAQITPANAAVQFGFSTSAGTPPTSWTVGLYVNSNLWGAYVPTPPTAGTWYAWVEGTDGSMPTVYPTGFAVT
jgi:hypothetical protein